MRTAARRNTTPPKIYLATGLIVSRRRCRPRRPNLHKHAQTRTHTFGQTHTHTRRQCTQPPTNAKHARPENGTNTNMLHTSKLKRGAVSTSRHQFYERRRNVKNKQQAQQERSSQASRRRGDYDGGGGGHGETSGGVGDGRRRASRLLFT